jgi:hypothetical protein
LQFRGHEPAFICVSIPPETDQAKMKKLLSTHPAEVGYFKEWPKVFGEELNQE